MKIHFTKKEFQQLIEMAFIADWITSGDMDDDTQGQYHAITQKIYAMAKDFGLEDQFEFDKSTGKYYESAAFEEPLLEQIDDYVRNQ